MNEPSSVYLDTSVVMRLLVGAPLDQFRQATRFLRRALRRAGRIQGESDQGHPLMDTRRSPRRCPVGVDL